MKEFLRDLEMIQQMEMMQELQHLERSADQAQPASATAKGKLKKKEATR